MMIAKAQCLIEPLCERVCVCVRDIMRWHFFTLLAHLALSASVKLFSIFRITVVINILVQYCLVTLTQSSCQRQ